MWPMAVAASPPAPAPAQVAARLTQADYRVVVATNQSGIARGLLDTRTLFAIHDTLLRALAQVGGRIDAFFFCPHAPDAGCPDASARKAPKTSLSRDLETRAVAAHASGRVVLTGRLLLAPFEFAAGE